MRPSKRGTKAVGRTQRTKAVRWSVNYGEEGGRQPTALRWGGDGGWRPTSHDREHHGSAIMVEHGIGIWRWMGIEEWCFWRIVSEEDRLMFFIKQLIWGFIRDNWAIRTIAAQGNGVSGRSDALTPVFLIKISLTSNTHLRGKTNHSILALFLLKPESLKWTNAHIAQVQDWNYRTNYER